MTKEPAMNRHSILGIYSMAALGIALLPGSALAQQKSLKDQLVGTWTLVSLENILPDGKKQEPYGAKPKGILMFDANGHYSIMHVPADRKKFESANRLETTPEEATEVMRGSFAQFGTLESLSAPPKIIHSRIRACISRCRSGTGLDAVLQELERSTA